MNQGKALAKRTKDIENEVTLLKQEIAKLTKVNTVPQNTPSGNEDSVSALLKYMLEEREHTNKLLRGITERLKKLEEEIDATEGELQEEQQIDYSQMKNASREIALSNLDSKLLEFVQSKGMVCAEDVKTLMNYKGKNAACARLNRLYHAGLLDRFQLGHRVYFKFDAGKTTNNIIISPPQ